MALSRKFLSALGIEADKIDEIINAHTETVDGLKDELSKAKTEAGKLPAIRKELEDLKAFEPTMTVFGFDESEWEGEEEQVDDDGEANSRGQLPTNQYAVIVMCKSETHQESVYNALTQRGFNCRVVAT